MRHRAFIAAWILIVGVVPAKLLAAPSWCTANYPDSVFCEDWDRYCGEYAPADPTEACAPDSPVGWPSDGKPWLTGAAGCASLTIEDTWISSTPFSGRAPSKGDLGNTSIQLASFIRNKFGMEYFQIMGTDQSPIVLDYVIDCPPGKLYYTNMYMELAHTAVQPLTDYILSDHCNTACGTNLDMTYYPIICRQSPPAPTSSMGTCPPIASAEILPAIAAGQLAYLDTNPCHCEGTDHFAQNHHLSFFDGKQWWILSSLLVPSTFPGSGDFMLHSRANDSEVGPNRIILTIKSTIVKVELYYVTSTNPQVEYSWCEIPRQYLGSFHILNFGYAQPCKLKSIGTWECNNIRQCWHAKIGATTTMDNIAISGGMGYNAPGACCILNENTNPPTISCVQASGEMDCTMTYGGQYKGSGTVCGEVPCCPSFLPDHDMDGDVDLEDFGWFQTCLSSAQYVAPPTVPCNCANLDGDVDVDTADFVMFADCLSGPGVPADENCLN